APGHRSAQRGLARTGPTDRGRDRRPRLLRLRRTSSTVRTNRAFSTRGTVRTNRTFSTSTSTSTSFAHRAAGATGTFGTHARLRRHPLLRVCGHAEGNDGGFLASDLRMSDRELDPLQFLAVMTVLAGECPGE